MLSSQFSLVDPRAHFSAGLSGYAAVLAVNTETGETISVSNPRRVFISSVRNAMTIQGQSKADTVRIPNPKNVVIHAVNREDVLLVTTESNLFETVSRTDV